jgi:hypothetical protein
MVGTSTRHMGTSTADATYKHQLPCKLRVVVSSNYVVATIWFHGPGGSKDGVDTARPLPSTIESKTGQSHKRISTGGPLWVQTVSQSLGSLQSQWNQGPREQSTRTWHLPDFNLIHDTATMQSRPGEVREHHTLGCLALCDDSGQVLYVGEL